VGADLIAAQQDVADSLLRLRLISRPVFVAEAQWPSRESVAARAAV
jgi:hypothetical protein